MKQGPVRILAYGNHQNPKPSQKKMETLFAHKTLSYMQKRQQANY